MESKEFHQKDGIPRQSHLSRAGLLQKYLLGSLQEASFREGRVSERVRSEREDDLSKRYGGKGLGASQMLPLQAPLLLKGCVTLGKLATSLSLSFLISEMGEYSLHVLVR